jgi:hypothetical protein
LARGNQAPQTLHDFDLAHHDVTWSMEGPAPCITKVMQVFCNMDAMIGAEFEKGLAAMKTAAEKRVAEAN